MSYIFCFFNSLKSIPNISKRNTNNATNMSYIFCFCNSLKSMPNISKWNQLDFNELNNLFSDNVNSYDKNLKFYYDNFYN